MEKRSAVEVRQVRVGPEPNESLVDLLGSLLREMAGLVRDEIALAKSEFRDRFRVYRAAISITAAGALFGLLAAMAGVAAAIIALTPLVGAVWASVIVAAVLGAVSTFLIMAGIKQFRR
jgi:amino acid transporter